MSIYCTVQGCNFPSFHNNLSHKCKDCEKYHSDKDQVIDIPLNEQCTIRGCEHSKTHTNEGHQCRLCREYGHSHHLCYKAILDGEKAIKECKTSNGSQKYYVISYVGMGGFKYHKYNSKIRDWESFYMTTYDWGTGRQEELSSFLGNRKRLEDDNKIIN
jgi:hypothetical protein